MVEKRWDKWIIGPTLGHQTSAAIYWINGATTPELSSPSPTPTKASNPAGWQDENIIISCWIDNVCSNIDATESNPSNCMCGANLCDASTGFVCHSSSNKCMATCTNTDGSGENSNGCLCGTSTCTSSTGHYCNSAENKCGGNCLIGSTFDLSIFVPETRTSKLTPGCKWSTVGTNWCVDVETDRAKFGSHTLSRLGCTFTAEIIIAAGNALKLTGDTAAPTVLSGMKTTRFFTIFGQLILEDLIFKDGKVIGNGGAFQIASFGSSLHMKRSIVCDCEATVAGGAVHLENGAVLVMEESTFEAAQMNSLENPRP